MTYLTRRDALRFAAGAAFAAVLAACGGETTATNTVAPATKASGTTTTLAGGTGGQTPGAIGTLAGGTGGQTPAPVAPTAAATAATGATNAVTAPTTAPTAPAAPAATMAMTSATDMLVLKPSPPIPGVKGNVRYWQQTFDDPNLPSTKYTLQWVENLKATLPNVNFQMEQYSYNEELDKLRVALRANQGPDVMSMQLLWGPEFTFSNALQEINLADFGYKPDQFWPGALKSITANGKLYGVPTNNETMAFIYNTEIFQKAGLDPMKGPETWEDVKNFSKQIKDKTGKAGFGLVAKLNAGNIPYRFMPLSWAYGGAALDETADNPTYQKSNFDNEGNIAALQWVYDVFVRDQSAPQSALSNTQIENRDLFISGEVAMMIDHPTAYSYALSKSPGIAAKMNYVLMPKGPVRRAVAFGGSSIVIFKGAKDVEAAKAVVKNRTQPLTSLALIYESSNPGNRDAFNLPEQQQRLMGTKFLNVTSEMLQYGVQYPAIPEAADIMNLFVPQMMQDVMTKAKTPEQSAKDTAKKVNDLLAKRK